MTRALSLRLLPAALLLAGVVVHGWRIVTLDEDPQRGTAFAMFATVDTASHRQVLATASDGAVLMIPADLADDTRRLRNAPSDSAAGDLAAALCEGTTYDVVRVRVIGLRAVGRRLSRVVMADARAGRS